MSELDVFESQVREKIRELNSPKASVRRKAAAWLGEAGDPSAIKRLTQLYESDPNARVRATAAYSLGMFRALEGGMQGDEPDEVYELLEDIALRGQMGRRVLIPTGCLARVVLGLVISLALLLVFTFVIWPQFGTQIDGILVGEIASQQASPADDLSALLLAVRDDATALQAQYGDVSTLDCEINLNKPDTLDISTLETNRIAIGGRINAQIVQLNLSRLPFAQACASESPALTAAEVSEPVALLETILADLVVIESELETVPTDEPATNDMSDATAVDQSPADTTPTVTEPTEIVADIQSHLPPLFGSLDEIRSPSGAYALMKTFWDGVSNNPVNSGCNNPVPPVPDDYVLPDLDANASSDLKLGVELYNTGLGLTRQGWALIATACANGTLMDSRETGLMTAANADISFSSAETLFTQVRDR